MWNLDTKHKPRSSFEPRSYLPWLFSLIDLVDIQVANMNCSIPLLSASLHFGLIPEALQFLQYFCLPLRFDLFAPINRFGASPGAGGEIKN